MLFPMSYTLDQLNQMTEAEFVNAVGPAFEATPSIAAQVWPERPFVSVVALHHCMVGIVQAMPVEDKLKLIKAHPDLGTRVAMAEASVAEQTKAGLTNLSAEEYERFQHLNQRYKDTFGFPFILAVAGHTKESILKNFAQRLSNSPNAEIATALREIERIAQLRLESWIEPEN
jgi:2-oxo-4-hydroxy-4-carboxy-5-ureidoimidazoline decarboxylase